MYKKEVTFSDQHPDNKPTQSMTVELVGGSPWYGYFFIDGEVYTLTFGGRNYKITKTK
jgi:hypothetical protein